MQFTPKTEEEIAMGGLLPEGLYPYKVTKSQDSVSRAGNEYIALTLDVFDRNFVRSPVFTNLSLVKLLKHFCDVNGMQEQYKSGNIPDIEFMGKHGGLVHIGIEPEKPNGNGGMYRAKNIVLDYVGDMPEIDKSGVKIEDSPFGSEDVPF